MISQILFVCFCLFPYLLCCYFFKVLFALRRKLVYYTSFLNFCQALFSKFFKICFWCIPFDTNFLIIHRFSVFVKYFFQSQKTFLRCRKFKRELIYYTSLFRFCQYLFSGFWYFLKSCDVTRLFRACLLYNICYFLSSTFLYLAKLLWTVSPAPNVPAYYTPFILFCQAENGKICWILSSCPMMGDNIINYQWRSFIMQLFVRK